MPHPEPRNVPSTRARFALAFALVFGLAGAPAEAAKGGVKGKPAKAEKAEKQGRGHGGAPAADPYRTDDASSTNLERLSRWSFGRDDERTIRSWFSRHEN